MGAATNKWHQNLIQVGWGEYLEKEIQPNIYCDQADSVQ